MFSRQPLFRPQALQHYAQSREKAILPRLVAPPVFLCCWLLLGLFLLATLLAWQAQVPIYQEVSGALVDAPSSSQPATNGAQVMLFVPAPAPELHVGAALTVQIVLTSESFTGTIAAVLPGVRTPDQARQQYNLTGDLALLVTQPSVVVQVHATAALPADASAGLSLSAQLPVEEQSVLSLLPHLLGGLLGG
jgi:hypothetical protein